MTTQTPTPETVLFIGLGAMGTPMASALARAGHRLLLRDADEARAAALAAELGGTAVGDLASLEEVSSVVLMLPDSAVVEAVLLGQGLLERLPAGALVIDMSSSRPSSTVALAAQAADRGIAYVDAPVSGGVAKAQDGSLAVMTGGDEAACARALPLLEVVGGTVTRVGGPGAGHAMKALNNLLSAIGLVAASEVLAVGARFGLEPQTMLDVLNGSTGRNHATEVKMARFVLSGAFDSGFSMRLMVKDVRTALDLAHETGTPVPVSAGALEEWTAALRTLEAAPDSSGPGSASGSGSSGGAAATAPDHTAIAAYVERRAGTELR